MHVNVARTHQAPREGQIDLRIQIPGQPDGFIRLGDRKYLSSGMIFTVIRGGKRAEALFESGTTVFTQDGIRTLRPYADKDGTRMKFRDGDIVQQMTIPGLLSNHPRLERPIEAFISGLMVGRNKAVVNFTGILPMPTYCDPDGELEYSPIRHFLLTSIGGKSIEQYTSLWLEKGVPKNISV